MTYDSQKHHRRSLRLKGYDYSQAGAYFITVCVEDRACLFGDVVDGQMHLNDAGRIVQAEWGILPVRFPSIELDVFGVMPNHIHGIIVMANAGAVARPAPVGAPLVGALLPTTMAHDQASAVARSRATTRVAPTPATPSPVPMLGDFVGAFKSLTTVLYINGVKQCGWPAFRGRLWQRNYHEHIIRDEESLNLIRQYILDNPACWASDEENPRVERPEKKKA
jgi:putative transposase